MGLNLVSTSGVIILRSFRYKGTSDLSAESIVADESFSTTKNRGVIGDIIHYFTLMSSELTLFELYFIFRHYSLFFQKYENNVIFYFYIFKNLR